MKGVLTLEQSYSSCAYLSLVLAPPLHSSLSFPDLSLSSISSCANQPIACSLSFMNLRDAGDAETCDLALSPRNDRRYVTVPLMLDLFKNDVPPIGR